jgi:hypothetical protein
VGFGIGVGEADVLDATAVDRSLCVARAGWPAECVVALAQPVRTATAAAMTTATRTCGHGKVNLLLKTVPPTECADTPSAPECGVFTPSRDCTGNEPIPAAKCPTDLSWTLSFRANLLRADCLESRTMYPHYAGRCGDRETAAGLGNVDIARPDSASPTRCIPARMYSGEEMTAPYIATGSDQSRPV